MSFFITVSIAIRALLRNKMRATLTVLGIVIGISAVTTMVSVGSSAGQLIQNEIQSIGSNFIVVQPTFEKRRGVQTGSLPTMTEDDARAIGRECTAVLAYSPMVVGAKPVIRGNTNMQPREMWGVGSDYMRVGTWTIEAGGFFTERDETAGNCVCVIGHTVVRELFPADNPIGQQLRIGNIPFTVVGVLGKKGADFTGNDRDNIMLMPYTTVKRRLQGSQFNDVNFIVVAARSPDLVESAKLEIQQLMSDRHKIPPGQKPDFEIVTSAQISQLFGTITGIMTGLLASIAGISLLVGGVGIMNIMLVSVTERTREIGIRMAMGARGWDIMVQFLIESVVLSCFGGVIGLGLGVSASVGITKAINAISPGADWPVVVSIPAGIFAMVFAAVVGLVFGLYPAWRASRLDPIDALRYE